MTETESRLAGINASSKQLEFENCVQITKLSRSGGLDAKSTLSHTCKDVPIRSDTPFERWQLGRAEHVEPLRIFLFEVVPSVEHHETIDIDAALLFRLFRFLWHSLILPWSSGCRGLGFWTRSCRSLRIFGRRHLTCQF